MNPIERRIRSVSDIDLYESTREAFPDKSDVEVIAELMRVVVFVAVCWNDVLEDGRDATEVLQRNIFTECDEIAQSFPWPLD